MTRWARFSHEGREVFGTVEGDAVRLHEGDLFVDPQPTGTTLPLAGLGWLPPVKPGQIIGLWNNFRAAAQRNGWAEPAEPLWFLKSPHAACGHQAAIPAAPAEAGRIAYEGELALVIGRPAHRIAREDAEASIFGYACANDVTAMELLQRDPSFPQWSRAKSFAGFAAFGPVVDTAFRPAGATLRTVVGGRERQNYPLDDMIFPPAELVFRIAQDLPLMPGDLILCGTSLGVLPMKPGTAVEIAIDGLGTLANVYG